jgi:hypothetical protein
MYFYMFFNFGPIIERKLKSETFFEKFRKNRFFRKNRISYQAQTSYFE